MAVGDVGAIEAAAGDQCPSAAEARQAPSGEDLDQKGADVDRDQSVGCGRLARRRSNPGYLRAIVGTLRTAHPYRRGRHAVRADRVAA